MFHLEFSGNVRLCAGARACAASHISDVRSEGAMEEDQERTSWLTEENAERFPEEKQDRCIGKTGLMRMSP